MYSWLLLREGECMAYDGEVRIKTKVDTSQMQRLQIQIDKAAEKVEALSAKYDELKNKKIPTEEYSRLESSISNAKYELESLAAEQKKLSERGYGKDIDKDIVAAYRSAQMLKYELQQAVENKDQDAYLGIEDRLNRVKSILQELMKNDPRPLGDIVYYDAISQRVDAAKNKMAEINLKMQELTESGKAFTIGSDKEEAAKVSRELSRAQAELRALITREDELTKKSERAAGGVKKIGEAGENTADKLRKMGEVGKKAFNGVGDRAKKSGGFLNTFASRLKGILLSLLIFNWITKAFNAMVSGMKEGFKNLVQYSDSYNRSMSQLKSANTQLKNSFATAFAPIVQAVIPHLITLINYITAAANKVAQLTAILTGKSTWTKATAVQEDYAASLSGTAAAAKKAAGVLASFDTLEVLNKKEDSSGGGAGAGAKPGDMFEEVAIPEETTDGFVRLREMVKPIIEYAEKLRDLFGEGFLAGFGDWESRFSDIKISLASIKESFLDIFGSSEVVSAADECAQKIAYALGQITGAVASIGLTIAQNLVGGIAKYLEDNTERIKSYLVSMFDISGNIWEIVGNFSEALAYIFEAFGSENGQQLTANIIGIFTDAFLGITELIGKFSEDIIDALLSPIIDNKEQIRESLEELLGVFAEIFGSIKETIDATMDRINEVYDEKFRPFFESLKAGLSELLGKFLNVFRENIMPVLQKVAARFDELLTHAQPAINTIVKMVGQLMEFLTLLWENILQPVVAFFIDEIIPVLAEFFDFCVDSFFNLLDSAMEIIDGIINIFYGFSEFLLGIFTLDFKRCIDGLGTIFSGLKGAVKGVVNSVINMVEYMCNSVIRFVNRLIEALNSIGSAVGFSMQIPTLDEIHLPKLATGAVIRGGNPFMAILGDQRAGQTNIETPLQTMVDAFNSALDSRGGSGGPVSITLNVDGDRFAQVTLDHFLSEIHRRGGIDVDLIGGY